MNGPMRMPKTWHVIQIWIPLALMILLAACGKSPATDNAAQPTIAPASTTPASSGKSAPTQAPAPQACALLTAADVEKITGYGGGLADSLSLSGGPLGEQATGCNILAGQGKFKVEVGVGNGVFPILTTGKQVDLEGGAKGIVKDSGIGQGWMSLVQFPNYGVTLIFGGTAVTLDPDKKIATVKKADGSTITYAQAYEALARAVAHNAATGAQVPSGVSDVNAKDDPCALLTLDDVSQVLSDFKMSGPELGPSAFGGNICRFRGHSDSLQATAIVGVVYFTQAQFQQAQMVGSSDKSDIGGATAYDVANTILLSKGSRYVRFSIDLVEGTSATMDKLRAGLQKWKPQLALKIASRLK